MNKVFMVDDDPVMLDLLKTLLTMDGFQVMTVARDEDIVNKISSYKPDLVLLDVFIKNRNGNEVNGFDILKKIKTNISLSSVKVIMTSGMDFRQQSIENGANAFVLKPFMPDELIKIIRDCLQ